MIKPLPIHVFFVFSGLLFSCNYNQPFGSREQEEVKSEVRLMFNEYYTDIREQGLLAEIKYLDSTTDFFWVAPGYPNILTYDSVIAIVKANAILYKSIDQHWDTLEVHPLATNLASYTGRITSDITDRSGLVIKHTLVETGIVIKRESGWKLLSGQTTLATKE